MKKPYDLGGFPPIFGSTPKKPTTWWQPSSLEWTFF